MILPDFTLPNNANLTLEYSGIDHLKNCLNVEHFQKYPYPIQYQYNSRGYRDSEWPESGLDQAIWCIGDSFTVGIGSPVQHTWPGILSDKISSRIINVSMDGASNNWMARKAVSLISQIQPKTVIIHWSYIERREEYPGRFDQRQWSKTYNNIKDPSWPECPLLETAYTLPAHIIKEIVEVFKFPLGKYINDHSLRSKCSKAGIEQDIANTWECINSVAKIAKEFDVNVINSFIPEFISSNLQDMFWNFLTATEIQYVPEFQRLDLARDGHHYDIVTATQFVENLVGKIKS